MQRERAIAREDQSVSCHPLRIERYQANAAPGSLFTGDKLLGSHKLSANDHSAAGFAIAPQIFVAQVGITCLKLFKKEGRVAGETIIINRCLGAGGQVQVITYNSRFDYLFLRRCIDVIYFISNHPNLV